MGPEALPQLSPEVPADTFGWVASDGVHVARAPAPVQDALLADRDCQIQLAFRPEPEATTSIRRLRPVYEVFPGAALKRDALARTRTRPRERRAMVLSVVTLTALLAFMVLGGQVPPLVVLGVILFGMSPFARAIDYVENLQAERLAQRDPAFAASRAAARVRYGLWAGRHGRSAAGMLLVGLFLGILLLQQLAGESHSIETVALVKERVAQEPYRLLTAAYMHANWIHLFFNGLMTLALARVLKPLIGAGLILWVFVVGALVGNLASWWLMPQPSVGASGGIMALVGVLAGLSLRRPQLRVVGLLRIALRILVLMAVAGLWGANFIDNAAHGGGALTGVVMGLHLAPLAAAPGLRSWRSRLAVSGLLAGVAPALFTAWLLVR